MAVVYVITNGDEGALGRLPEGRADLIIFITTRLATRAINRISNLAYPALADSGELIVASSLPDAIERL